MTDTAIIPEYLMGEVWPAVHPGAKPADYGRAVLEPSQPVVVRSFQTLRLTYTVGAFGLDDTGAIKIVQRFLNDGGKWQTSDPSAMNYVTARASNGVTLDLFVERYNIRPWDRALRITVVRGSMHPGDTITVTFGDTSAGGPGLRMQTFCEGAHEFRVLVDACATGQFIPIPDRPALPVRPGPPHTWRVILPSLRQPGSDVWLGLRADDIWGNPSDQIAGRYRLVADGPITNLPDTVQIEPGQRAVRLAALCARAPGIVRVHMTDEDGQHLASSNPMVVRTGQVQGYWGDLHGQSGETVGVNPITDYFAFGRDLAMLEVMSHQANDFQLKNAFWDQINETTAAFNDPGRFVAFPGYEWSGNTPMGGDHNVIFHGEGSAIRRSSHAMLTDRGDRDSDAQTSDALFKALQGENVVCFGHVGGRPADIAQADGGALRTAVEVHSDWGTFEWIMADSFDLGYRHGLVCNSDGHKGRPGASHPGASDFGALGGLTCFLAPALTRDGIFQALRDRHHFGTTGARMHVDVDLAFDQPAARYRTDPRLGPAEADSTTSAIMGDIVGVAGSTAHVTVSAHTQSPILSIDILRGMETIHTQRPYGANDLGTRVRVCFHGAEYRGRGRQTRWQGSAKLSGSRLTCFEKINAWNHDRLLQPDGDATVAFDLLTTGNFVGFDIWLDQINGTLAFETALVAQSVDLGALGLAPLWLEAGGLGRGISVTRLPDTLDTLSMTVAADVAVAPQGDTPVWTRINTEDGHRAWSSPAYLFSERP